MYRYRTREDGKGSGYGGGDDEEIKFGVLDSLCLLI